MAYETTIDVKESQYNQVSVDIRVKHEDSEEGLTFWDVDRQQYAECAQTAHLIAHTAMGQLARDNQAQHPNVYGENMFGGVLAALLSMRGQRERLNPLTYTQGQPGFELLQRTVLKHREERPLEMAEHVSQDIADYERETRAAFNHKVLTAPRAL